MIGPPPDRRFPTTRWSIVARLKSEDPREAVDAVKEIFLSYRYPLYGYLRTTGMNHENAEDVLQGFFEKMLRNDSLGQANQTRGKLRTFLLACLSNFRINWLQSEQRHQQRVRSDPDLWEADEARYLKEQSPSTQESPERFYDRRWAAELISLVRQRLREHYEKRGKQDLHAALSPLLSSDEPETGSFTEIAARLDTTLPALRVALHRLRKDFRDLLLQEVKRTLDEGEDARTEIRHLLSLFE